MKEALDQIVSFSRGRHPGGKVVLLPRVLFQARQRPLNWGDHTGCRQIQGDQVNSGALTNGKFQTDGLMKGEWTNRSVPTERLQKVGQNIETIFRSTLWQ